MSNKVTKEKRKKEPKKIGVFLDASSISNRSIIRIVFLALLVITLISLFLVLVSWLKLLFFVIVVSIFTAYLLNPLVKLLRRPFEQRGLEKFMPQSVAIIISYLIVFIVLGVLIAALMPSILEQSRAFAVNLPNYGGLISERITELNNRYEQLKIPDEIQSDINQRIREFLQYFSGLLTVFVGNLAINIVTFFPWAILVPVLSFFFLKDSFLYRNTFLNFFPSGRWRARAESFVTDVNNTLAAYTNAQLISCVLVGLICILGFTLIGLDYALLLGILAGVLEFIPLIGPLIIGIIATLISLFSANPIQAVWIISFLTVLRFVQSFLIYPRVVRDGIHLNPLAVILSVLAGQQIAGISGVFLSIPVVALITVLHKHILEHSGRKGLFSEIFGTNDEIDETEDPSISNTQS